MGEWRNCVIADIGTVVGGATPSTKNSANYDDGGIAWITPKDLSSHVGRYIARGERNISEYGMHSCSTRLLPKNTVLFSSRAPIGYIAIASNELCTNQGFKSVVPNDDIDPLFLYYLLKYNKEKIENMGSGTTFKEVSGTTMKNINVRLPIDKKEQIAIASILGELDNRIELNYAINKNLEEQAQAIFQRKFIDFDRLPRGWKEASLLDIADYINGLPMQKFRPLDNELGLPVLKIKELRQGFCDASSDLCTQSIKSIYIVHDGDVIFSWSGSLMLDFWCGDTCGLNQHLFKVTSKRYDKWFYFSWTKYHLNKFIAIAADMATTMGHIKRNELSKAKVLVPSLDDYHSIGELMEPLYARIITNRVESRHLSSLRDSLLPYLLSGEADISNIHI